MAANVLATRPRLFDRLTYLVLSPRGRAFASGVGAGEPVVLGRNAEALAELDHHGVEV